MNETYEEYMKRKLSESVQSKVTLYADDTPYQVIDLKDIADMTEEEYNDKLKDAWLKKTHYETVEELNLSKYYNYEVEEEPKYNKLLDFTGEILATAFSLLFYGGLLGVLFWIIVTLVGG